MSGKKFYKFYASDNAGVNGHGQLVGGLEHFLCFHILGRITPTDFHIFQRGSNHQPVNMLWSVQECMKFHFNEHLMGNLNPLPSCPIWTSEDNTWLSGALFNPLEHGADLVVESLTKYVSAGRCIGGGKVDGVSEREKWWKMQVWLWLGMGSLWLWLAVDWYCYQDYLWLLINYILDVD